VFVAGFSLDDGKEAIARNTREDRKIYYIIVII
jgi:hypothetical protein